MRANIPNISVNTTDSVLYQIHVVDPQERVHEFHAYGGTLKSTEASTSIDFHKVDDIVPTTTALIPMVTTVMVRVSKKTGIIRLRFSSSHNVSWFEWKYLGKSALSMENDLLNALVDKFSCKHITDVWLTAVAPNERYYTTVTPFNV